jgi:hypothetical protein
MLIGDMSKRENGRRAIEYVVGGRGGIAAVEGAVPNVE